MAKDAVEKIKAVENEAFSIYSEAQKQAKKIVSDAKAERERIIEDEKQKAIAASFEIEEKAKKQGEEFALSYIEQNRAKNEEPITNARIKKESAIGEVIKLLFFQGKE